jgi:hypothetical protein
MQSLSLRLVSCSAVLLTAFGTSLLAKEFKHQHIEPAPLVNPWNAPDEEYLEPSITEKLKPGMRVAVPDFGEQAKWYVQRLTYLQSQATHRPCSKLPVGNIDTHNCRTTSRN